MFYKECFSSIGDDKGEESLEVKRLVREFLFLVNLRDVEDYLKGEDRDKEMDIRKNKV